MFYIWVLDKTTDVPLPPTTLRTPTPSLTIPTQPTKPPNPSPTPSQPTDGTTKPSPTAPTEPTEPTVPTKPPTEPTKPPTEPTKPPTEPTKPTIPTPKPPTKPTAPPNKYSVKTTLFYFPFIAPIEVQFMTAPGFVDVRNPKEQIKGILEQWKDKLQQNKLAIELVPYLDKPLLNETTPATTDLRLLMHNIETTFDRYAHFRDVPSQSR